MPPVETLNEYTDNTYLYKPQNIVKLLMVWCVRMENNKIVRPNEIITN